TPATLVLGGSFTASNKTYDATTAAQIDAGGLSIASGLFDGDVVTILSSGATGVFADKNVGEDKAVTLTAAGVLTGGDAGNYVVDTPGLQAVTAVITPATLVLGGSFTASNKTYDATT